MKGVADPREGGHTRIRAATKLESDARRLFLFRTYSCFFGYFKRQKFHFPKYTINFAVHRPHAIDFHISYGLTCV